MISDWVEGGTLEDQIKERREKGQVFSEKEVYRYFTMILLAVEQTHHQCLLYRNISSGHVYFFEDGRYAKLGLMANMESKERDNGITKKGFAYERHYLSPEMVRGKKKFD